jgi:hypothetical protein
MGDLKMRKGKITIFLGLWMLVISVPCFGIFSIDDLDIISHGVSYNALPSVEKADAELRTKSSFHDFLSNAERIVLSHGLEDLVGLRLIHRHFPLDQEHVMVEKFGLHEEVPSLITSAQHVSIARENEAVPASWIVSGAYPVVFEFSTDTAVRNGIERLRQSPLFFTEIMDLIKDNNLQELLAISVSKRSGLEALSDQLYVEHNFVDVGSSIVQIEESSNISDGIRTGWAFSGPKSVKCRASSVCLQIPPEFGGGHEKSYMHED